MSTSRRHPLYNALRGTLAFEVNFTGWRPPCQKYPRGRLRDLVKFTFRANPLQNTLRGTSSFKVNFTGQCYPCQKYPRGRLSFEVERFCDNDFVPPQSP